MFNWFKRKSLKQCKKEQMQENLKRKYNVGKITLTLVIQGYNETRTIFHGKYGSAAYDLTKKYIDDINKLGFFHYSQTTILPIRLINKIELKEEDYWI